MTDRKPDFYRIARGAKRDRGTGREWYGGASSWVQNLANAATVTEEESTYWLKTANTASACGARLVPVYVKVTRKPKLHDFAWALRRMREGKRVRRASWYGESHIPYNGFMAGGMGLFGIEREDSTAHTCVTMTDLLATDWHEAP